MISVEYITIAGVPAVMCLRRVAHEQVMEAVVGNILIPLATGVLDITAFQHTQETGYREHSLLNMAMQKYPGEGMQKLAQRLGQPYFDDPVNDAQFPTHPLTCVRAAFACQPANARTAGSATRLPSQLRRSDARTMRMLAGSFLTGPTPASSSAGRV